MPEECQQKESIMRIDRTLERVVAALEKVADQGARLDSLEDKGEHYYRDLESLFSRVRDVELTLASNSPAVRQQQAEQIDSLNKKLDKVLNFMRITTSKPALYAYGAMVFMVLTGTVLDLLYHFDTIKAIWQATH